MPDSPETCYVGHSDFHDGSILGITHGDLTAQVRVRGASGRVFFVDFVGVQHVNANHPTGMMLYALCESHGDQQYRHYVFVNWDDEDDATLEIDAEGFSVRVDSDL